LATCLDHRVLAATLLVAMIGLIVAVW